MSAVKSYRPDQVSISVGGSLINSWDKVTISKDNDKWSFQEGTTGELARTKNLGKLGTITIELPQTSSDNSTMSAYEISDATIAVSVIDRSGATVGIIAEGTIVKAPDAEFGKETVNRTWIVKGALEPYVVAGN